MNLLKQRLVRAAVAVALVSIFGGTVAAQELRIGVVSIPVLMERAPQAKVAMDALQEEFAPRQRMVVAKQAELAEFNEKVRRDFEVMGETERRNAEKELRDLQRESTRLQNEFREDLNLRRNEELGKLQRSLLKEVQDYAETTGFDLIVGDGVLYASSTVNITELVLRAMEANFNATGAR
ncbi:MAG: OmpH family outer membrane protein [Proteobacteria bacterium]|nr:OmpH family outer membrane protein [Pseudomonadota bacterium]